MRIYTPFLSLPFAKARRNRDKKIHIVILSVSEISTEFKICLKALNSHFKFMDTSPKAQYDKKFFKLLCHFERKALAKKAQPSHIFTSLHDDKTLHPTKTYTPPAHQP